MISDRRKPEGPSVVASIERRKYPRYAFSATAEIVEASSGARVQGRVSDLGRGGCYVDAMSPFGVKAEVQIRIVDQSSVFVAQARVVFSMPGMGMGLMFTAVDPEQSRVLDAWLGLLRGEAEPAAPAVESPMPSLKVGGGSLLNQEQNYVLNELIIALMRKNVLSDTEGKALLQKLLR